ncbi:MAG TPA: LUD domain-containing protein [Candidatus Sulfotelmatobacter sp.]|nr:LUD domain-containing protein [Candidatus Sulfotelmatobacter sp.]
MSDAKSQILGRIRGSLKRDALPAATVAALDERLARHARNLLPQRVARDPAALVALFVEMATAANTEVTRLAALADVPGAVATLLARENLPAELVASPALADLPWAERPLLTVRFDRAHGRDAVSVTPAFAAIAETGTLMLVSGADTPSTLNFLPDTHVVVLKAKDVVGPYEDALDRLRARSANGELPRTINFVTGPSRTGDIEQTIQLGAHGPRRLHILLVEDDG